jgi:very-short-patch-repair endonuclease
MPVRNTVIGQPVRREKAARARELRRAMTPAEGALWQRLRGNRLNGRHFRRQQVITGFIVDFYCHAAGVIVNVDGVVHEGMAEYDRERDETLKARGFRIVRLRNDEVLGNIEAALAIIEAACGEGGGT